MLNGGLFERASRFLRTHGLAAFLQAIPAYFRERQQWRQARSRVVAAYPEKYDPSAPPGMNFDTAAEVALRSLFAKVGLQADAARVLSLLKEEKRLRWYHLFLIDLFKLNRSLEGPANAPAVPIVQAADLPPLEEPSPRRNILFITSNFPNPHHGGGNRVLNFMKFLSRKDDIYLASVYVPEQDREALPVAERYCRSILKLPHWQTTGHQRHILNWLGGRKMDIVHYEWPSSLSNYSADMGRLQIFTYMEAVSLRIVMDMRNLEEFS
ncbi:MAG TPA: hypothetical protein VIV15_16960, partial [Anaerolineales bacterium]